MKSILILYMGKDSAVQKKVLHHINETDNWTALAIDNLVDAYKLFYEFKFDLLILDWFKYDLEEEIIIDSLSERNPSTVFLNVTQLSRNIKETIRVALKLKKSTHKTIV